MSILLLLFAVVLRAEEPVAPLSEPPEVADRAAEPKAVSLLRPLRDFHRIQGRWEAIEIDAQPLPAGRKHAHVVLDGLRLTSGAGAKRLRYEYSLDSAAEPARIDLYGSTSDAEPVLRGLYRFQGDRLQICLPRKSGPRPETLAAPNDGSARLLTLRRVDRPRQERLSGDQLLNRIVQHVSGANGKVNYPLASSLILQSANSGDPRGELWLATRMFNGRHGFIEMPELARKIAGNALPRVRSAAEQGDHHAQLMLAEAYELGLAVEHNMDLAAKWNKAAWARGNVCAIYNLGRPWGESMASRERYRVARDHGHVGAAVRIVTHIRDGADTRAEPLRAIREYRPLTQTLSPEAMAGLGRTLARFGKESEQPEALLWTRRGAEAGDPGAMHYLGVYLLEGRHGAPVDKRIGVRWMWQAALAGSQGARDDLVYLNASGAEKYRNSSNYEDPEIAAARARFRRFERAVLAANGGRSRRSLPPDPYAAENARYEQHQQRKLRTELRRKFNAQVVPGLQKFPYGPGYIRTGGP